LFENAVLRLGDRSHLKLNITGRPITKKYREGKVKRILKRRSKVLEIVMRETVVLSYRLKERYDVSLLLNESDSTNFIILVDIKRKRNFYNIYKIKIFYFI